MRPKFRSIIKVALCVLICTMVLLNLFQWTLGKMPRPKGPVTGTVGVPLTFEGKVRYDPVKTHLGRWDFGDGTVTEWQKLWKHVKDPVTRKRHKGPGPGRIQTHTYTAPGTYKVRWRARCPLWLFIAPWSNELTVVISEPESN